MSPLWQLWIPAVNFCQVSQQTSHMTAQSAGAPMNQNIHLGGPNLELNLSWVFFHHLKRMIYYFLVILIFSGCARLLVINKWFFNLIADDSGHSLLKNALITILWHSLQSWSVCSGGEWIYVKASQAGMLSWWFKERTIRGIHRHRNTWMIKIPPCFMQAFFPGFLIQTTLFLS